MTSAPPGRRMLAEIAAVFAIFAAGVAILPLAGGASLWTRPFWLDELCCTVFPVSDSRSFFELFANVRHDDVAPPLLHMIVWTVGRVTGSISPTVLRMLMVAFMVLSLLTLYAILRRRFGRVPSFAGAVAVAGHALLIHHAFDARFYGPWLFFGAVFAWVLGLDRGRPSPRRDIGLGVLAVCLCTIHWFGVTTLALLSAGAVAAHGRRWREGLRLVAPGVAGLVALAALSPMMVAQLHQGGDALLWVPPLNTEQVGQMSWAFIARAQIVLAVAVLLADRLRTDGPRVTIRPVLADPAMAAVLSLALMPVVLIVISAVLESVMVPRYAILAILIAGPVVALAAETLGRAGRTVLVAVLVLLAADRTMRELRSTAYADEVVTEYKRSVALARPAHIPIVFQSYFLMYLVDGPAREHSVTRFLELPDSSINMLYPAPSMKPERDKLRLDRAQVLLHQRVFGFPVPITQARLDSAARFYLFAHPGAMPPGFANGAEFGARLFPKHTATSVNGVMTLFEREAR